MDDDDLSRRGISELLSDRPEFVVVAALTHQQALCHPRWDSVDVAIVDAADETKDDDQFPGVEVAQVIRERGGEHTCIIVVTGHFFDDAIRRRMREVGADYFYNRIELHDAGALYQAVLSCHDKTGLGVPAETDPEAMFHLGVTPSTRVNAGVRFVKENPLDEGFTDGGIRRARARLRYRQLLGREAGLNPVNADGRPPDRDQEAPSVPQIQRFIEWATKVKDRRS